MGSRSEFLASFVSLGVGQRTFVAGTSHLHCQEEKQYMVRGLVNVRVHVLFYAWGWGACGANPTQEFLAVSLH